MAKKYSLKFWLIFWFVAIVFLLAWGFYWNTRNNGISSTVSNVVNFLPLDAQQKKEYQVLTSIGAYLFDTKGQERTLMVLFQNNMEIRPGGGFIGSFGIVKIKDGQIISLEIHDLSNFDGRIPATIEPPYPMKETLHIDAWKLRDSNFSPDFEVDAKKAQEFYYLGQGGEKIDAVVGITTNVLSSVLKITGPIQLEGYPGTYDSENAIIALEYQVEKAFDQQGIPRGERKSIMGVFAKELEKRVTALSAGQKLQLAEMILVDLQKKDIQLQFEDPTLQKIVADANWAGKVDQSWNKDYLMNVDANLGAFKSDYYVKRSLDYTVDFSAQQNGGAAEVTYKITYQHTATQKDWMTRDYLTYLRLYVPEGSWLKEAKNFDNPKFGNEFGRKYFGAIVKVPINSSKTVEIKYALPVNVTQDNYDLKIQKQAGLNDVPMAVHIIKTDGKTDGFTTLLNRDIVLSDFMKK